MCKISRIKITHLAGYVMCDQENQIKQLQAKSPITMISFWLMGILNRGSDHENTSYQSLFPQPIFVLDLAI